MTDKQAQHLWTRAQKQYFNLCEALLFAPDGHTDEKMHERLQHCLDSIREMKRKARVADPYIGKGVHIATIRL